MVLIGYLMINGHESQSAAYTGIQNILYIGRCLNNGAHLFKVGIGSMRNDLKA